MCSQAKRYLLMLVAVAVALGCVEEIPLATESFEDILVIEALITDVDQIQEIKLTRTFTLEEERPDFEAGARVAVSASNGKEYIFDDAGDGVYRSRQPFAVELGVGYTLNIETASGENYVSTAESITSTATINQISTAIATNGDGERGLQIAVDGQPFGEGFYFLYQYEETYQIISQFLADTDFKVINRFPPQQDTITLVPKTREENICYNTNLSEDILVTSTTGLQEELVSEFPLRFLNQNSPLIAHRYSILVRQFSVNRELYQFYNTLKDLSESENVFAQNQPGFIEGNITLQENPDAEVIGFFNVATVSEERIFLEYGNFFDDEDLRGKLVPDCMVRRPSVNDLFQLLLEDRIKFLQIAPRGPHPIEGAGPYRVVPTNCMDCTTLGTNVKPDFWID